MVEPAQAGQRADVVVAARLPALSRARVKSLIESGAVTVDGAAVKPATRLHGGERIAVELPQPAPETLAAEPIPLDILFEDDALLVVNKPPGLTVHPGAGQATGTLANALLAHVPALRDVGAAGRPGIVHRLDKDTSGLLVVAKTPEVLQALQRAVAAREVVRRYLAVVRGRMAEESGTIDAPIGRHPRHRTKMAVIRDGRPASTRYRVLERYPQATLIEARLITGRTHQIRVHVASLGHPVLGDRVYGGRRDLPDLPPARQMLHAYRLAFAHPVSGLQLEFEAPPPDDFAAVLRALRAEGSSEVVRKPRNSR